MKRTGALFLPRLSPSSTKSSKMALACIRTAKTNFLALPFIVSTARVELTRNISKMARSCKAGRNKRREVKVGQKFSVKICTSHVLFWPKFVFLFVEYMFNWEISLLMIFKTFFTEYGCKPFTKPEILRTTGRRQVSNIDNYYTL